MADPYTRWETSLRYFHNHFRDGMKELLQESENCGLVPSSSLIGGVQAYIRQLEFHHGIEDEMCFPLLARRLDVSSLQSDHDAMDAIIADIRQSCRTHSTALGEQLAALAELVLPHMTQEEQATTARTLRDAGFTLEEMAQIVH